MTLIIKNFNNKLHICENFKNIKLNSILEITSFHVLINYSNFACLHQTKCFYLLEILFNKLFDNCIYI